MKICYKCKRQIDDNDALYCSKCGTRLTDVPSGSDPLVQRRKSIAKILLIALPLNILIFGGVFFIFKGCSKVEGNLVATGEPMGNFTFVPKQCRSGQHMNFFGAIILGAGPQDGAVVPFIDPAKGKQVKVEVPGSCEPPDYEKCKEVIIEPKYCSQYDVVVDKIPVMINDIVMMKGHLNLDCTFPGGGTAKGTIIFDRCD